jgi:hypothetical protein
MSALPPKADTLTGDIDVRLVPEADILAAVSHCSVPSSRALRKQYPLWGQFLTKRRLPPSGDLCSSKNLDFQAPWHHFQLVRLIG